MFWLSFFKSLCGGREGLSLSTLGKVWAHVALEVEVGELLVGLDVKERAESRVGVNLAAIACILKGVSNNVLVDLLRHLSASHLSSRGLAKEGSELVANKSGLHKSTRSTGTIALLGTLGLSTLSSLELTGPALLKSAELGAEGTELRGNSVEARKELSRGLGELSEHRRGSSLSLHRSCGNLVHSRSGGRLDRGRGGLGALSGRLLGLGGLGRSGCLGSSGCSCSGLSCLRHIITLHDYMSLNTFYQLYILTIKSAPLMVTNNCVKYTKNPRIF